jgi:hypothetical protein
LEVVVWSEEEKLRDEEALLLLKLLELEQGKLLVLERIC